MLSCYGTHMDLQTPSEPMKYSNATRATSARALPALWRLYAYMYTGGADSGCQVGVA